MGVYDEDYLWIQDGSEDLWLVSIYNSSDQTFLTDLDNSQNKAIVCDDIYDYYYTFVDPQCKAMTTTFEPTEIATTISSTIQTTTSTNKPTDELTVSPTITINCDETNDEVEISLDLTGVFDFDSDLTTNERNAAAEVMCLFILYILHLLHICAICVRK